MADLQRTIEIVFGAVDRDTKATIREIDASLNALDTGVQGIATPLANFADKLLQAEAAIAGLAAVYGGYAIEQATKFQSAQLDLQKQLEEGEPSLESFTQAATDLSEQYGVSADVILQGIANFKEAGFTAQESVGLQKDAMDLMIAGTVDSTIATESLISSLKGFNAEASEAPRFIEAMNNVSNTYATDVNQLADGMGRVAPILKIMGFSFEEGTGLLTPMIEVFRSGGQAAEALKTGLLKLVDDAKPVTTALAAMGVSQFDLNGKMRSGKDIFYDVATAFQSVDQNQKLVFAGQLFGIEQAPKLVTVFDNLAKVNEITATAMAETGSVTKEVELRLASAEKQIDRFKVSFENLARVLGSQILGEFSGIVGGAADIESSFRKVVEAGGLAPLFDALKPQLADFEALLKTMAQNLPEAFENVDFSGLLDAFGNLGDEFQQAFNGIFGDVDLTTVDGLTSAIQTTINIISAMINVTSGIVDAFSPIFEAIGEAGRQVGDSGEETQVAAGKLLGAMEILKEFGTTLGGLLTFLKETKADITNVFNVFAGAAKIFINVLQIAFDSVALIIIAGLEGISGAAATFLDAVGADEAAEKFRKASESFREHGLAAARHLTDSGREISDGWDQMADGLTGSSDKASSSVKKVGDSAANTVDPLSKTWQAAGEAANKFIEAHQNAGGLSDGLKTVAGDAGKTAEELDKLKKSNEGLAGSTENTGQHVATVSEAFIKWGEQMHLSEDKMDRLRTVGDRLTGAYLDQNGRLVILIDDTASYTETQDKATLAQGKFTEEIKKAKDPLKDLSDSQKLAIENAHELELKLLELASDERIKAMEFQVQLNVEGIKGQVEQVKAALTEIGNFYKSNADVITQLTEGFSQSKTAADREFFKEQISRQLDMEQQVVDSQVELNASISELNRAYAASLTRDTIVKIESDGLDESMELFMFEVLKRIQTKVVGDRAAFLLGAGKVVA